MKIRTAYNHQQILAEKRYEKNDQPSLTIPDQTLTIPEILRRYARGIPLDSIVKLPIYDGEDIYNPDMRTLDLTEQAELIEQRSAELKKLNKELEDGRRVAKEKFIAERRAEYQKWLDENKATVSNNAPSGKPDAIQLKGDQM